MKTAEERKQIGPEYHIFDYQGKLVGVIPTSRVSLGIEDGLPVVCVRNERGETQPFSFNPAAGNEIINLVMIKHTKKPRAGARTEAHASHEDLSDEVLADALISAEVPTSHENHKEYSLRFLRDREGKVAAVIVFGWCNHKIIISSYTYDVAV